MTMRTARSRNSSGYFFGAATGPSSDGFSASINPGAVQLARRSSLARRSAARLGRVTLSPRESTFVLPFYLKLMRTNATWVCEEVWDDLVIVGRTASLDDVLWLLAVGAWRPV